MEAGVSFVPTPVLGYQYRAEALTGPSWWILHGSKLGVNDVAALLLDFEIFNISACVSRTGYDTTRGR